MIRAFRIFAALCGALSALAVADSALAQRQGGVLRVYHRDSPASMSIHEEDTVGVMMPMMGVFNNLVLFDQHVPQNSLHSIVPELATSWAWSEDGKELTFKLRGGVKLARWPAIYRGGRQMHLRLVDQPGERKAEAELSRDLVGQCGQYHDQWRP